MENNIKKIQEELGSLAKYISSVENKVKSSELDGLSILALEKCTELFHKYEYTIEHYEGLDANFKRHYSDYYKTPPDQVCERLRKMNEENLSLAKQAHERNLSRIEINKKIIDGLTKLMLSLGFPKYKRVRVKSRSIYPKYEDQSSGWMTSLSEIPISDNFSIAQKQFTDFEQKIVDYKKKKDKELIMEEQKQKQSEKEKAKIMDLARFQLKYELANDADFDDVLDVILNKNKYLRLAYFLCLNRGDWTDGCNYARQGLNGFLVENPIDQSIQEDISYYTQNWDGDGRVFRDCKYSYDVLFAMVEDQFLIEDYNLVKSYTSEY